MPFRPRTRGDIRVKILSLRQSQRERYCQRLADARVRLASYRSHGEGGTFAFAGELAEKRRQLAEVDAALAMDIEGAGDVETLAA